MPHRNITIFSTLNISLYQTPQVSPSLRPRSDSGAKAPPPPPPSLKSYQTLPMYNVRFSKQIFLALLSSFMVQDPSSLLKERADYIYCIRAMRGHQENKICPSKASEVNRPVWCSISAHIDHLVATLHHLPKGFL